MTEFIPTTEWLEKRLASLGKGPGGIARKLKKLRIYGHRKKDDSCPLANYIRRELGKENRFLVSVDTYGIYIWLNYPYNVFAKIDPVSKPVQKFISDFDTGKYPELVLTPED